MPYVVPQPPRTIGNFESGVEGFKGLTDLLLQALLSGQISRQPSAGQYTSPTGQSTFVSPAERVASNPSMSAASAIQNSGQGSFQPTRYSGLQFNPSLDRQLQQAKLNESKAFAGYLQGQTPGTPSIPPTQPTAPTSLTPDTLDADTILKLKKAALDPQNPQRIDIIQLLRDAGEL